MAYPTHNNSTQARGISTGTGHAYAYIDHDSGAVLGVSSKGNCKASEVTEQMRRVLGSALREAQQ